MKHTTTEIETLRSSIHDFVEQGTSTVEKGQRFIVWVLTTIFGASEDEALNALVEGGSDRQIDAALLSDSELLIVQGKYSSSHNITSLRGFRNITSFEDNDEEIMKCTERIKEVVARIRSIKSDAGSVQYCYVTDSLFTQQQEEESCSISREDPRFIFLDINGILSRIHENIDEYPKNYKDFTIEVMHNTKITFEDNHVLAVTLDQIFELAHNADHFLFHSNIRQSLKTKVNDDIEETIKNTPNLFWKYNNGITIVCDDYTLEGKKLTMTCPQVVNGCQTVTSIRNVLKNQDKTSRSKYSKCFVLVRVYKDINTVEKKGITQYTNSQNSIRGLDFFALDEFQKQRAKSVKSRYHYYLEIQRGSYSVLKKSDKSVYSGLPAYSYLDGGNKVLPIMRVVQCFVSAFYQDPFKARLKPSEYTPFHTEYDKIFNDNIKNVDDSSFVFPYLISKYAENVLLYRRDKEVGYKKYGLLVFVSCFFRLFWTLCSQNEKVIPEGEKLDVNMRLLEKILSKEDNGKALINANEYLMKQTFQDRKLVEDILQKDFDTAFKINKHKTDIFRTFDYYMPAYLKEHRNLNDLLIS